MSGKKILKWCWFPVLLLILVAWYFYPVRFLDGIAPQEVASIQFFDGNTGCAMEITDQTMIAQIVENIQSVPVRRTGISLLKMGYRFQLTLLDQDGKELDRLILDSEDTIRKDPFFFTSDTGGLCYDLIWEMMDRTYGSSSGR